MSAGACYNCVQDSRDEGGRGAAEGHGGDRGGGGRRRGLHLLPGEDARHLRRRDCGDRRDPLAGLGVLPSGLPAVVRVHACS